MEIEVMDDFKQSIKDMITEYDSDIEVSDFDIMFAINTYKQLRNFSATTLTEEDIMVDMMKNVQLIAMATIEIEVKRGAEGQKQMGENGINRTYFDRLEAYNTVVGYAG